MKRTRIAFGTVLLVCCLTLSYAAQGQTEQSQPSSSDAHSAKQSSSDQPADSALGDYARKVRKEDQGKSKRKVFDNDNLPREQNISIVGAPSPENSNTSSEAATPEAAPEAKGEQKPSAPGENKSQAAKPEDDAKAQQAAWKQWQDKLSAQKNQIDLLQRESEVLQREYQIRAAAFYADAGNRLRNQGAWDKQDADYKQQIADKQKALDEAKQKLEDLDEEARKAGVPAAIREP